MTTARVLRVVLKGCPYRRHDKNNFSDARKRLMSTFESRSARNVVSYAITSGGFVKAPFPHDYKGKQGWNSHRKDFEKLIPDAKKALDEVLTDEILRVIRGHTRFLTLGIDLINKKRKGDDDIDRHAELVAVVETSSGNVGWTGKSYPTEKQQDTLVHQPDLESHHFKLDGNNVLVLGCHDLNMFIDRGRPSKSRNSRKKDRKKDMRRLAIDWNSTVVLHHPHFTDTPNIWAAPWGSLRRMLPSADVYASGIAYCNFMPANRPRKPLEDVLDGTKWGDVEDIVVRKDGKVIPSAKRLQ